MLGDSVNQLRHRLFCCLVANFVKSLPAIISQINLQSQRSLDRDLSITKRLVREYIAFCCFFEVNKRVDDSLNVRLFQLAVLLAQILAKLAEPLGRIDQLNLAFGDVRVSCW